MTTTKKDAVVLGHIQCEACGGRAAVYQSVVSYLYTRCADCGIDQRNGKRVQERLYWMMNREPGAVVSLPRNLSEDRPDWLTEKPSAAPEPVKPTPSKSAADRQPATKPAPKGSPKGGGGKLLMVFGVIVGIVGVVGAWV